MQKKAIKIDKKLKFALTTKEYIKLLKTVLKRYLKQLNVTTLQLHYILKIYDIKINKDNILKYLNVPCNVLLNYLLN